MSHRTVTLDSEYLKKVRRLKSINFHAQDHVINTLIHSKLMKIRELFLGGGFLSGFAVAALGQNRIMEAVPEALWQLIKLIIPVNFDGFLRGIHNHMAFVAPMKMLVQLDFQVLADLAVKIIGQLL